MTVLYVFNNAGGAVGIQLGNLDLSINISQRSRLKKKVCMCEHVLWYMCVCLGGCLAGCLC